jgi:hypothetical protein
LKNTEGIQKFNELRGFFHVEVAGLDAQLHDPAPVEAGRHAPVVVQRGAGQAHFVGKLVHQQPLHVIRIPLAPDVLDLLGDLAYHRVVLFFLGALLLRLRKHHHPPRRRGLGKFNCPAPRLVVHEEVGLLRHGGDPAAVLAGGSAVTRSRA